MSRRKLSSKPSGSSEMDTTSPLLATAIGVDEHDSSQGKGIRSNANAKTSWIAFAILSGICAACNGVFAKLTTTELTTSWAHHVSTLFGFSTTNSIIEYLIRGTFFSLNLAFNALMWALFTTALTRAISTTRVSIINTSSNFMVTAVLGLIIFKEKLPPLWWVGAAMLVVGTVVIGKREEEETVVVEGLERGGEEYRDEGSEAVEAHGLKSRMEGK